MKGLECELKFDWLQTTKFWLLKAVVVPAKWVQHCFRGAGDYYSGIRSMRQITEFFRVFTFFIWRDWVIFYKVSINTL
ncbi:hypothetical protein BW716_19460 [[Flexibacter] sp. ATCC 35208]|nr:hypothetical protein BW716_19460 [[Flexibacter] sp. ATCC 35208]